MPDSAALLADALLATDGLILVVTGAGISSASGIPTFRGSDPDAIWKVSDVELATRGYFESDPIGQWSWYLKRFEAVDSAQPNPAHTAIVGLEAWQVGRGGEFLLVTQNIDTLHEAAGSKRMIKIHGTSDRLRCVGSSCPNAAPAGSVDRSSVDLERFRRDPRRETLPMCPACGDLLRAHVLFFDEYYQEHNDYRFQEVLAAGEGASLLLFIGTSFSVGITEILLRAAFQRQTPMFSVDPGGNRAPAPYRVTAIEEPAEKVLPLTLDRLTG
jgi:NAD-dependent deacetylase